MRAVLNDDERRLMPWTTYPLARELGEIGAVLTGHAGDERDLAC